MSHWSSPRPLPGSAGSETIWLSVNPRARAIIAWVGARGRELVSFRTRPLGTWAAPADLGSGEFPAGTLDPHGSATIVWARLTTGHHSGYNVIDAAVHAFH